MSARPGGSSELARRTQVTRLGEGVDATGALADAAIARVRRTLDDYAETIDGLAVDARIAVLTSAVRDSANGGAVRPLTA